MGMLARIADLKHRVRTPELMDDIALEAPQLHQALTGLARLNRISRSADILFRPIRALAQSSATRPLRILDVATGGGDVPLALWHRARQAGIALDLSGCDVNPRAIAFAQQQVAQEQASIQFFVHDALQDSFPSEYDVVITSLFLHHLDEDQAVQLLQRMAAASRHTVLVNDLCRGLTPYGLVWLACHVLSRSPIVHADGPSSVSAAFTIAEVQDLAQRAGLEEVRVTSHWPCRYLLRWYRQPDYVAAADAAPMGTGNGTPDGGK